MRATSSSESVIIAVVEAVAEVPLDVSTRC